MPQLRRTAHKLLRQVGQKPHASDEDHEDAYLTPPASNPRSATKSGTPKRVETEEDILADPISSDEEEQKHALSTNDNARTGPLSEPRPTGGQYDGSSDEVPGATFKRTAGSSQRSSGSKRKSGSEDPSSDSEEHIFGSQKTSPFKRPKMSYTNNIHAPPPKRPAAKLRTFGRKDEEGRRKREQNDMARQAKKERGEARRKELDPKSGFRRLKNHGQQAIDIGPAFRRPNAADDLPSSDYDRSSSPLSSIRSSPEVEEGAQFLPPPEPYLPTMTCAICGTDVPRLWKESFDDTHNPGRNLTYRWQQRFCRYHKTRSAREEWEERGYPEIEWNGLKKRLAQERNVGHVRKVLRGEVQTLFRGRLEGNVKKRGKGLQSVLMDQGAGKTGGGVGYYGPRGEKMMTDFILSELGDDIRDCSTTDDLMAASGVSGGVSGFVQSILVPELAVSLVTEDLGPENMRNPVEVLAESAELGELLHPEVEDMVRVEREEEADD